MRAPGVSLDPVMSLDVKSSNTLTRARFRQNICNKAVKSGWGFETSALQMTLAAALGSLLRYALTPVGLRLQEDLNRKVETQIDSVAARRVSGFPRSARPVVLHMLANTSPLENVCFRQCSAFLDGALRVTIRTMRTR